MTALVYTSRALTGREGKLVMQHFSVVSSYDVSVELLTMNSNLKKLEEIVQECTKMQMKCVELYKSFYDSISQTASSWEDVYAALDVSPLKKYSGLFVIGGIHYPNSALERGTKRMGVFPVDKGQLKYQSVGKVVVNILAILKAHREYGIPVHQICFDPAEVSFDQFNVNYLPGENHYLYHGYDIPLYNIERLDSCQYGFEYRKSRSNTLFDEPKCVDKSLDFVFGYTANSDERAVFIPHLRQLASNFVNSRLLLKTADTDDLVDRDAYLTLISKSKYTYMLQSYDKHCFSIYRFVESLENDCLPLIHENVNVHDVSESFGFDLSVLKTDVPFQESERIRLLSELKEKFLKTEKLFKKVVDDRKEQI